VFIIGGQAFPLSIFPGFETTSTFADGQIGTYSPSLPEIVLGFGGLAVAFVLTIIGVRVLNFMPHDKPHAAD
jgi:molybdopterin-containing oxidoreductase family membrane subunit